VSLVCSASAQPGPCKLAEAEIKLSHGVGEGAAIVNHRTEVYSSVVRVVLIMSSMAFSMVKCNQKEALTI